MPPFLHLTYFFILLPIRVVADINEIINAKHCTQLWVLGRCAINVYYYLYIITKVLSSASSHEIAQESF